MSTKKWFLTILGLFGVMVAFGIWLGVRVVVPVNPWLEYFPEEHSRVPVVQWRQGTFQPVYLYAFSKGDKDYLRVMYRNTKNNIRILDVLVGDRGEKKLWDIGVTDGNGEYNKIDRVSDYSKYFQTGDRIAIEYLRSVIYRPEPGIQDPEVELLPDGEEAQKLCEKLSFWCYSKDMVYKEPDKYWNFQLTGDLPADTILAATSIKEIHD